MINDDDINKWTKPILERQQQINLEVLTLIANRIKQIGTLTETDIFKLYSIYHNGADIDKINSMISKMTNLQVADIQNLIKTIAVNSYLDMRPFYDARQIKFIPYEQNKRLQMIVNAIAKQTSDTYVNLSKSTAFMLRDPKNPSILVPTTISDTYQRVIDTAIQATATADLDYQTAMRNTLEQLTNSGIRRVTYNTQTGKIYTQRLDTAVSRNLLDGIRAINQGVQDETGKQFGSDGKEITVHAYPAPDHAPVQGHQFSNEEFEKMQNGEDFMDWQGNKYTGFDRAIGTLNCKHFTFSIVLGFATPNYTDEQLQEILDNNEKGYTLPNGKHLTMYECTQYQRRLETQIRYAKDGQIISREAGDTELAKKYQSRINKLTSEYNTFTKNCGLQPNIARTRIKGYRKIKV